MKKENKNQEYFGLTNDVIFGWIMESDENCLAIIRAILPDLNLASIVYKEAKYSPIPGTSVQEVQFYVEVQDDQDCCYAIEIKAANTNHLGLRTRYYQAQIDEAIFANGQTSHDLKECFVIFLCSFDPFGCGLRRYQFHQYEDTLQDLRLGTQSHTIIINAQGTKGEVSDDLAGIIDVMNQKPNQTNPLANKLMKEIDHYNQDLEKRQELIDYETSLHGDLIGEKRIMNDNDCI